MEGLIAAHDTVSSREGVPKNRKAADWLSMAEDDIRDGQRDHEVGSHASAVYHAEQSAQKAIKALIAASGFDPGKTHKPTVVLKSLMAGGLIKLDGKQEALLGEALAYAISLEDQGTLPRYGWEAIDRVVKPSEIYDRDKAYTLLANAERVLESVKRLLAELDC